MNTPGPDPTPPDALQWFRHEVCGLEGHKHGPEGEFDCLLMRLAQMRAATGASP